MSNQGDHITDDEALELHSSGRPGKLEITPTKPLVTQRDLSLAYSPGVAVPVHVAELVELGPRPRHARLVLFGAR